jgi:hypothetical protein
MPQNGNKRVLRGFVFKQKKWKVIMKMQLWAWSDDDYYY